MKIAPTFGSVETVDGGDKRFELPSEPLLALSCNTDTGSIGRIALGPYAHTEWQDGPENSLRLESCR